MSVFLYCGGHHDSDRTAVLVWSPRLKLLYCKYHQFMYTLPNKDFLPSFLPSYVTCPAFPRTHHWLFACLGISLSLSLCSDGSRLSCCDVDHSAPQIPLSAILVASPMFALAHSSMSLSQVLAGLPLPLFPAVIPWMMVFSRLLCLMM